MATSGKTINNASILIGVFLLVEGIWGMFSDVVFGVLSTNRIHAGIHIILGITGIVLGQKNNARGFLLFLGALLVLVGILRFIPGADALVINILNVNFAVAYFNIIVGAILLLVAFTANKTATAVTSR